MQQNSAIYHEGVIALAGVIDIFEADRFHAIAMQAADDAAAPNIVLDLSRAEQIDISALQVICALRRGLESSGRKLIVHDPAAVHEANAVRLGLFLASQ
jgi:anti-anti-sigma regulatory factor